MRISKRMYNLIKCIVFTMIFTLTFCLQSVAMSADAAQEESVVLPQAVKDKETGVVRLLVYAVDQEKKQYNIRQGTGVLVGIKGDSQEESEIILTSDELIRVDDTILTNIRLKYGLSPEADLDICIDVVLQVGARVKAETQGEGDGFVVLEMSKDISGISSLSLGNSAAVNVNDRLYMIGYGGNNEILGQEDITGENTECMTGIVSSISQDVILIDSQLQEGFIGVPVLGADGYVVGMVAKGTEGLYIQPIDKIKSVLDVLNIQYKGIDTENHYNEPTDEIKEKLDKILFECQMLAVETDQYTGKSIKKLKTAIDTATKVIASTDSTYDDYESAIKELEKYRDKLRKKDYPIHVVQFGLLAAILLFSFLSIRNWLIIKRLQEENKYNLGGFTSQSNVIYAKLIRTDTGQEIPISSVFFRIGKSEDNIDYVITDNTSISRHHADIIRKDSGFYIVDNNSTNYTFVNDKRAMPGEQVPIISGDIIRMSDICFRFEI